MEKNKIVQKILQEGKVLFHEFFVSYMYIQSTSFKKLKT